MLRSSEDHPTYLQAHKAKCPLKMKMPSLTLLMCSKLTSKAALSGDKYLTTVGTLEVAVI